VLIICVDMGENILKFNSNICARYLSGPDLNFAINSKYHIQAPERMVPPQYIDRSFLRGFNAWCISCQVELMFSAEVGATLINELLTQFLVRYSLFRTGEALIKH